MANTSNFVSGILKGLQLWPGIGYSLIQSVRLNRHAQGSQGSFVKTIIEPFKIKVVEPIQMTTIEQRMRYLNEAKHNLFKLSSDNVIIDLLTDSGTSAMSSQQWAGVMVGDESYAGSPSWIRFEKAVKELTNFNFVLPTHQGRAAESLLFSTIPCNNKIIPNNTHFDTTRANAEMAGAIALDLPIQEGLDTASEHPFKGNIDLVALEKLLQENRSGQIPLVMITVTNNSGGGQPVSLENLHGARKLCDQYEIPLYLDACRFAENAWFIKQREPGQFHRSVKSIAQEMFSLADGCTMSAKKDAFANMGGFLCTNSPELAAKQKDILILKEGFPTYGGLSGRDLEAIAIGLEEILSEDYLHYRSASIGYLNDKLHNEGIAVMRPTGGHAVYLDATKILPQIPAHEYPGQVLACELYLRGGVRSCEIGTVMFGTAGTDGAPDTSAALELVRLAIPRRVYTQSHMDYVGEVVIDVFKNRSELKGYQIVKQPKFLRHFTAQFKLKG